MHNDPGPKKTRPWRRVVPTQRVARATRYKSNAVRQQVTNPRRCRAKNSPSPPRTPAPDVAIMAGEADASAPLALGYTGSITLRGAEPWAKLDVIRVVFLPNRQSSNLCAFCFSQLPWGGWGKGEGGGEAGGWGWEGGRFTCRERKAEEGEDEGSKR